MKFDKGFTYTNLKNFKQFYFTQAKGYALSRKLTWTHHRLIMRINETVDWQQGGDKALTQAKICD